MQGPRSVDKAQAAENEPFGYFDINMKVYIGINRRHLANILRQNPHNGSMTGLNWLRKVGYIFREILKV